MKPCVLYDGPIFHEFGYGRFVEKGRWVYAHRRAYERAYGPIPPKMSVLHKCDTPACVEPEHLYVGTQRNNLDDIVARNRRKGERHALAKLTEQDVRAIRARYAEGKLSQRAMGALYGVGQMQISRIVRGERWSHVRDD